MTAPGIEGDPRFDPGRDPGSERGNLGDDDIGDARSGEASTDFDAALGGALNAIGGDFSSKRDDAFCGANATAPAAFVAIAAPSAASD